MKKEVASAVLSTALYMILPDVLDKAQTVCAFIAFYMAFWSFLTFIEEIIEKRRKIRNRCKKRNKTRQNWCLYEQYKDGTYHVVPNSEVKA